ncbi:MULTISPECIES: RNA polymerase sigma factor SigM [Mycobacteriaceae]|uniref:RNA polymerase sigma factor SigM n=1 Tax=Mycobacteriaceae TaxID=1762 RepID=UPI0007FE74F6|nr:MULTISPECIES: RNA polymerase sigma factor SigM [Mycobacteriaceae]MCK0175979.1 RNA polymerase sigma factor SigM [Mycolicibacterium sp. F2034L]OBB58577.1 RNA polymerase sigma factor SigM [Mycobacterium sp. 852013-51886_SCH5428379]
MGSFDAADRSDAQLLAAHVAGERYAFDELYLRHRRQLTHLAQTLTRHPQDAEEALQDAMMSAHHRAAGFRHDSTVGSWLYRIVVNACLDRLRRAKCQPTTALLDGDHPIGDPTAHLDVRLTVRHALMRLPVDQRAAVLAVDMQGYSVAETARLLGVAEGTVKSRCSRGRARLAAVLREADGTPRPGAGVRRAVSRACDPSRRA